MASKKVRLGERDKECDPQVGDQFPCNQDVITIEERRMRRTNEHVYGSGTAKDLIFYRLRNHPGCVFVMGASGLKKRLAEAAQRDQRAAKKGVSK